MSVTVVICAHTEATRIAPVLTAVTAAAGVDNVIVVADCCSDATATVAGAFGAAVIPINAHDKGTAMRVGATASTGTTVLFIDADVSGLRADQVTVLATTGPKGGMVVGVRGQLSSGRLPVILGAWPSISGERRVPRDFALRHVHTGSGWKAETLLDAACAREGLPHRQLILDGVANTRPKDFRGWLSEVVRVAAIQALYAPTLARYAWTMQP